MTAGPTIREVFAEMFSTWQRRLPPDYVERGRGKVTGRGWTIQYLAGQDQSGAFLDVYAHHRMTSDRHIRIRDGGSIEEMPAWLDLIVYPLGLSEEEREERTRSWGLHNERVAKLLEAKGFEL